MVASTWHQTKGFYTNAGGLSGIGLGLGPGGQPIDATQLNRGGMGNMGPGGKACCFLNLFGLFQLVTHSLIIIPLPVHQFIFHRNGWNGIWWHG